MAVNDAARRTDAGPHVAGAHVADADPSLLEDDLSGIIEDDLEDAGAQDYVPAPWDEEAVTAEVIAALRTVQDPEIPVNIYDLGLIYRINLLPPFGVEIDMTLTAPGCPVAGELVSMVQRAVLMVPQVDVATVKLVFDPPWESARMTEEVKLELGLL